MLTTTVWMDSEFVSFRCVFWAAISPISGLLNYGCRLQTKYLQMQRIKSIILVGLKIFMDPVPFLLRLQLCKRSVPESRPYSTSVLDTFGSSIRGAASFHILLRVKTDDLQRVCSVLMSCEVCS